MRQALADNGFHEPVITYKLTRHAVEQLVDIAFAVISGVQAAWARWQVSGDSGMIVDAVPSSCTSEGRDAWSTTTRAIAR